MPQSLARIWLHIVFSTKDRRMYLQHDAFRDEMFRMVGHHVNAAGCVAVRAGGWHDHLVCGLSRTVTVASLVEQVKVETSKRAKSAVDGVSAFAWQAGYSVFSVSQSSLSKVVGYVNDQESHHKSKSFQDEFRELCLRHELDIDERYVWD